MGKIIRNGIEYSATSDTANNINYDNSLSGLSAVTMQEAVDEVNNNITSLNDNLEKIETGTFTPNTNITIKYVELEKKNNHVRFNLRGLSNFYTNEIGKGFVIGKLPSGFITCHNIISTCMWNSVNDLSWRVSGVLLMDEGGNVIISSTQAIEQNKFDQFELGVEFDVK